MLNDFNPRVYRQFFGGFSELRPIQEQAMPCILRGDNVLIRAGTGSGKTEAAIAPLISRHWTGIHSADGVSILYVTPTRALANDLKRRLQGTLDALGLTVGVRHYERNDLLRADIPDVLITTPESAEILLSRHDKSLKPLVAIVIDEIHSFYNEQRGMQLSSLLRRYETWLERSLQFVGVSATAADASQVSRFFPAMKPLIDVDAPGVVRTLSLRARAGSEGRELADYIGAWLGNDEQLKFLVFANSRNKCDQVAQAFRDEGSFGDAVFAHHSAITKDDRERSAELFASATRAVCVATSTLEVGIDIGDIDVVVLFGVPFQWQSFLQRIGRAGRRSERVDVLGIGAPGRPGKPPTTVDDLGFQALERQVRLDGFTPNDVYLLYGAVAQQILAMALEEARNGRDSIGFQKILRQFQAWDHLTEPVLETICDALIEQDLLRFRRGTDVRRYSLSDAGWELEQSWEIFSNFTAASSAVKVYGNGREVGEISGENLLQLHVGDCFLLNRLWEIERIVGYRIYCRAGNGRPIPIRYSASAPDLDPALVDNVRDVIAAGETGRGVQPRAAAAEFVGRFGALASLVSDGSVPYAYAADSYAVATFGGLLLNRALAQHFGDDPEAADDIFVRLSRIPHANEIPASIEELEPAFVATAPTPKNLTRFQALLPLSCSQQEQLNKWSRDVQHHKTLDRLRHAEFIECDSKVLSVLRAG